MHTTSSEAQKEELFLRYFKPVPIPAHGNIACQKVALCSWRSPTLVFWWVNWRQSPCVGHWDSFHVTPDSAVLLLVTVWRWVFDCGSLEWISRDKALVPVRGSHSGPCLLSHFPRQTQLHQPGMPWPPNPVLRDPCVVWGACCHWPPCQFFAPCCYHFLSLESGGWFLLLSVAGWVSCGCRAQILSSGTFVLFLSAPSCQAYQLISHNEMSGMHPSHNPKEKLILLSLSCT